MSDASAIFSIVFSWVLFFLYLSGSIRMMTSGQFEEKKQEDNSMLILKQARRNRITTTIHSNGIRIGQIS